MKEIQGIRSAIVLERKGGIPYIQTEGVNFGILEKFAWIDKQSVTTNDIQAMAKKFGVIYFFILDLSSQKCVGQGSGDTFRSLWCIS